MKTIQKFALATGLIAFAALPSGAQYNGLPDTGTYFIVNAESGEALEPGGPSAGQNVFAQEYKKGGVQKWVITRKIDPVTKKPNNRYEIKLAGEADGLYFQPHPVIGSATAIISTDKSVFELAVAEAGGYYIKSVKRNGDALFTAPQPPMPTEVKFGPIDSSAKFRWAFDRAD